MKQRKNTDIVSDDRPHMAIGTPISAKHRQPRPLEKRRGISACNRNSRFVRRSSSWRSCCTSACLIWPTAASLSFRPATRAFSETSEQCQMMPAPRHPPARRCLPVSPTSDTPEPAQSNCRRYGTRRTRPADILWLLRERSDKTRDNPAFELPTKIASASCG